MAAGRPGRPPKPALTVERVLAWADAHHARAGQWPKFGSGPIPEAPGETWKKIGQALQKGQRGLPRTTLARLLYEHRGASASRVRRRLALDQVLSWADAWRERWGRYPAAASGPIPEAGMTWLALDLALRQGGHGLPGGMSLAKLLQERRGRKPWQRSVEAGPKNKPAPKRTPEPEGS